MYISSWSLPSPSFTNFLLKHNVLAGAWLRDTPLGNYPRANKVVMKTFATKDTIQTLVHTAVESYAQGFQARHEAEVDNAEGIINMKIHNVFIEALGKEIQYYAALVRSLDSLTVIYK